MARIAVPKWEKRRYAGRADTAFRQFLAANRSLARLTDEDEEELRSEFLKGRREAREVLILNSIWRVTSIARKFLNRGLPYEDLVQEGTIAGIEGVDTFLEKDNVFALGQLVYTRVKERLGGMIAREYYGNKKPRIPRHEVAQVKHVVFAIRLLTERMHRPPNVLELVWHTRMPLKVIGDTLHLCRTSVCSREFLDDVPQSKSRRRSPVLGAQAGERLEKLLALKEQVMVALVSFAVETKAILIGRLGLNGEGRLSLGDVAKRCKRTIYEVGRIETDAVQQLAVATATSVEQLWRLTNDIQELEGFLQSKST